jgi:pSer/pThr/pTyr-binding forkhead associated (FHA) protein
MTVSIDGHVLQAVPLTQARTRVGRRPYNDIVLEHLSVSGEHAVLLLSDGEVILHDLNSTNGSYVNGQPVRHQVLQPGDLIEIGACTLSFEHASIRVLSGMASGRELPLVKPVTTLGQSGVATATITRQGPTYALSPLTDDVTLRVNGSPVTQPDTPLRHGDLIELAGSQMQFLQP